MPDIIKEYKISKDYEVMNLSDFIKRVSRKKFDGRVYGFNTLIGYSNLDEGEDTAEYQRKAAVMIKGSELRIALNSILMSASGGSSWKVPIQELYESMVVEYLWNLGTGNIILKLGSRRYTVVCPDDFAIISGKQGSAFACYAQGRLKVMEMYPITEKEANRRAQKFLAEQESKK